MSPVKAIVRRRYADWDEFLRYLRPELFGDGPFVSGRYLFRGVANADWKLVSSFDRQFPHTDDRARVSAALLNAFRDACGDSVEQDILADDVRLLALGQHFGLPTRLLDWTISPFVAAFFALSDALVHAQAAGSRASVWALHLDAGIWDDESGVEVVTAGVHGNVRLRTQGGRFTRSRTPFASLEEFVEHAAARRTALTQLSIPVRDAPRGLAELEMMGVDAARMFPDLGGAAQAATMRVRLMADGARNGSPAGTGGSAAIGS
jgi:hypothetical protein